MPGKIKMQYNIKFALDNFYKDITWYEEKQNRFKEYTNSQEYRDEFGDDDPSVNDQYHWLAIGEYHKYFEEAEKVLGKKPTIYDLHLLCSWILRELFVEFRDALDDFARDTIIFKKNIFGNSELMEPEYKEIMTDNVWDALEKERLKIELVFNEYVAKVENVETIKMETLDDIRKNMDDYFNSKKKDDKLTDWQIYLSDEKHLLFEDGKRVMRGKLPEVVAELVMFTKQNYSYVWIQEHFLQENFNRFSKSACEQARTYANTH